MILRILKQINPWASLAGLPTLAWWLALATFLNRAGTMVLPFLLLYLIRHLRWEPEKAALILTLYGLTSMVAGPVSGRLCDRFGSGKVLCCSLFASSCVMLVFPLVTSAPLIAATTVLLSFFSESFRPAALSIQARVLTPELRQRGFTLNRLAANAGMSIGPAVGGLLASLWFPAIFLVDGLSALLRFYPYVPIGLGSGGKERAIDRERHRRLAAEKPELLDASRGDVPCCSRL